MLDENEKARLMELTGYTDNFDEAMDQFALERKALSEAQDQQEVLKRIKNAAEMIRKICYGRRPMVGPPHIDEKNIEDFIIQLDILRENKHQAERILEEREEIIMAYKQLPLFAMKDKS